MYTQVLDDRVYHIDYVPATPEPYYQSTGRELQPRPVGEENGQVVYNYYPISAVNYVRFLIFIALKFYFTFEVASLAPAHFCTATLSFSLFSARLNKML